MLYYLATACGYHLVERGVKMNTYRVDRVNSRRVPCGMNSIRYIGDNANTAHKVFDQLEPGFDVWDRLNCTYGVVFSVWNGEDYVIKREKGLK
jgi:hypothetical protein